MTVSSPPQARLRRLPVPSCEPPYDDEIGSRSPRSSHPGAGATQGTLALAFLLPSGLPATPRRLALASPDAVEQDDPDTGDPDYGDPDSADDSADDADATFGPQATPRELLPEPRGWAARLVQALVEVLAGDRPTSQLVRWTNEDVYATVQRRVRRRAGAAGRQGDAARAVVRSVHVSEPVDGVAEVCALVQR
ncbi:MAG: Rv3235 family protein, partial [Actinomycetota bacterium]|nr:Rv3235 family protein [Actinomycetota bacterium]